MKIFLREIRYIEGLKDYVKLYLEDEMIISKVSLKEMAVKLPSATFLRIHRSYIVSKQKIKAFTHEQVEVDHNLLPIGNSYRQAVISSLS